MVAYGSFCWFELSTSNQDDAKHFYNTLFDWQSSDSPMGPPDMPNNQYTQFRCDGKIVASAYTTMPEQVKAGVPPNWLAYVMVQDADAAAARIATNGGTVVAPPFDVMDYGRMAMVQDPTGAMFAVWQPKANAGVDAFGTPGAACWVELSSPDPVRAAAFYRAVFGWKIFSGKDEHDAGAEEYGHIVNGSDMIGGVAMKSTFHEGGTPAWLVYFAATDCAAKAATAKSLGAHAIVDTMEVGENGTIAVLTDRQGAVFAIHQPPAK